MAAHSRQPLAERNTGSNTLAGNPPRILIVEDHVDARLVMEEFLARHGYDVSVAKTGDEGLALLLSDLHYDLVLLDLMLPRLGGLEILKALRTRQGENQKAPVIIVSAFASNVVAGAQKVLQKPVDLEALLKSVAQILGVPPLQPTPR